MTAGATAPIREMLAAYGLSDARLEVLRDLGNLVVHVQAGRGQYGLRVCAPGITAARVEEELRWLAALRRDTDLVVPVPAPNNRGATITPWAADGGAVGAPCLCVLFNWVEGSPVSRHMSEETASAIGSVMARLHRHALSYSPARRATFVGPRYDHAWLSGPASWWRRRAMDDVGADVHARLAPAIDLAAATMRAVGETDDRFGVIHSDLHFGNILVDDGRYAVIDFDGCALGHYLFDIAVTEAEFLDYPDGPDYVAAFRRRYCAERGIPALAPRTVDALRVAANVAFLEWVFTSPNPAVRVAKLRWAPGAIEQIRASGG